MATNDITGDKITTGAVSSDYRERFSSICWSKLHFAPIGYDGLEYKCPSCERITLTNGQKAYIMVEK